MSFFKNYEDTATNFTKKKEDVQNMDKMYATGEIAEYYKSTKDNFFKEKIDKVFSMDKVMDSIYQSNAAALSMYAEPNYPWSQLKKYFNESIKKNKRKPDAYPLQFTILCKHSSCDGNWELSRFGSDDKRIYLNTANSIETTLSYNADAMRWEFKKENKIVADFELYGKFNHEYDIYTYIIIKIHAVNQEYICTIKTKF